LLQLVGADDRAGPFGDRLVIGRPPTSRHYLGRRFVQETAYLCARRQERFHLRAQGRVVAAVLVQKELPLSRRFDLGGRQKDLIRFGVPFGHVLHLVEGPFARLFFVRQIEAACTRNSEKNQDSSWANARYSQVRASSHRRSAARRPRPSRSAASWCSRPAKKRSFTSAAAWASCRSNSSNPS